MPYTPQELTAILQKYKAGKQSLERRVIAAENWWKLRNRFEEDKRPGAASGGDFRAVSGWLHNVIVSKHADAMEAYPEPVILPREPDDRAEAELLSAVVPCILEQNAFERTWSDAMWQKLKTGTAAYRVGWDPDKLGGLGDISIERVDLLNLFWEPGVSDIQKSKFVFFTHLEDNEELEEQFPELRGRLRGNPFTATRFLYDDAVSLDGKSTVVEAYYRRRRAGRSVLHYVKYVGETVLYSTENDSSSTQPPQTPETFASPSQPPLCKGSRFGESRTGGIALASAPSDSLQPPQTPETLASPSQPPLCKGSRFGDSRTGGIALASAPSDSSQPPLSPEALASPSQPPLCKGSRFGESRTGGIALAAAPSDSLQPPQTPETFASPTKPPLCKGRWFGESRTGGIDPFAAPSDSSQPPLSPEAFASPTQSPLCKGSRFGDSRTGGIALASAPSDSPQPPQSPEALASPTQPPLCKGSRFGDSRTGGIAALPGGFEPAPEHAGLYDHGSYPFVLDPLFPVEGSPCGYGFVDLCHNNQTAIDLMRTAIIKNTVVGATPRYFQRIDGSVNEEEFADLGRALVHVSGNLGEDSLRQIGFSPLSGVYMDVLNSSIQELRETSGNTETSTGNISSGVTAASAIAALQEASGKGSRDSTRSSYLAYARIVELCIELIRQFYGLPRSFRIAGRAGAEEYIRFSNAGLCPRPQQFGAALPVFDVKVSAQKRSAYSRLSQNELAMELYRMGIFDSGHEQEALSCLRMMEFDGRDELIARVTASMGLREKLDELQKYKALALAFARRYRPDMAEGLTGEPAAPNEPAAAQPAAPSAPAAAGDGGAALPPPYMP